MNTFRQRKFLFALLALLAIFAGCKGESPTAPPPSSGGGSTPGGGTPATGTVITVSFSNTSPVVSSPVTVSAAVTQNNATVPNGTAVELSTSLGTFSDSGTNTTIRTTTNGVATAILNVTTPGTATVVATINNVSKANSLTFRAEQVPPTPTPTNPTITGVTPTFGKPSGGETVTINGTNFTQPLRVFFDFGNNTAPVEAFVLPGSTSTQLQVLSPKVDLGAGQTKPATIIVITQAGSTTEQRATSQPFTFLSEQLTPTVSAVSPASGPATGGTRVTIFGDAFQSPVQVFFGASEAQIVSVSFSQIIVISPAGRDTSPNGSDPVTTVVPVRVVNILSNKEASLTSGFRYTPKMRIIATAPGGGNAFGGTDVTIDGIGFDDPVAVTVAGIAAQPLRVSGTQLLVRTSSIPIPCSPLVGPIIVTNVENGDTATGGNFSYTPVPPIITGVSPTTVAPGSSTTVTVLNPGVGLGGNAFVRFLVGSANTISSPTSITDPVGPLNFSVQIPAAVANDLPLVACQAGGGLIGQRRGTVTEDITFVNVTTTCRDVLAGAITIALADASNPCVVPPPAAAVTTPPNGACADAGNVPTGSSGSTTIVISNQNGAGGQPLTVSHGAPTGANASDFTVAPANTVVPGGQSRTFTVTFTPGGLGVRSGSVQFTTNDPNNPTIDVCLQGTGVAPGP